jgi:hypothetical protein
MPQISGRLLLAVFPRKEAALFKPETARTDTEAARQSLSRVSYFGDSPENAISASRGKENNSIWDQFVDLSIQGGLIGLPVASRQGHSWLSILRKENNSIRVVLHERIPEGVLAITPKDPGIPPYLLYGPMAAIKLRCPNVDVLNQYLTMMYGPGQVLTEILQTKEWALVAALNVGEIPIHHRVIKYPSVPVSAPVWNSRIFEAGLHTQNHDKGCDRFVGKFNPGTPMEAVMAIAKAGHYDHGTAIYSTQEKRRCLLLDTLHGLTDEEALWYTPA